MRRIHLLPALLLAALVACDRPEEPQPPVEPTPPVAPAPETPADPNAPVPPDSGDAVQGDSTAVQGDSAAQPQP